MDPYSGAKEVNKQVSSAPAAPTLERPDERHASFRGIDSAVELFAVQMELPLRSNGLIDGMSLSGYQVAALHEWHRSTTEGCVQIRENEFYAKVYLAASLWPNFDVDGNVEHLFGKGTGVEIVLQGEVVGRTARPVNFPIRHHSDFEHYGVTNLSFPYAPPFYSVFGAQEFREGTKALAIPAGEMHERAEVVAFGGIRLMVPQLEVMFLDKYLSSETTPRPVDGREPVYDAIALAEKYPLDRGVVGDLYQKYFCDPKIKDAESAVASVADQVAHEARRITRVLRSVRNAIVEEHPDTAAPSVSELVAILNAEVEKSRTNPPSMQMFYGIEAATWIPLTAGDVNESLIVAPGYTDRMHEERSSALRSRAAEVKSNLTESARELDNVLRKIEEKYTAA